jgi:hypothetical protein
VRADSVDQAREVALLLERLEPEVVALLPEARTRKLEVWVQESPALYRFARHAYQDADGFYSDAEDRIHLRAQADSLERTLAHELVHAHLRGAWQELPGTLEEGLCDHVSGRLCPEARSRLRAWSALLRGLRAGRPDARPDAAHPGRAAPGRVAVGFQARLRLEGDPPLDVDPLGVFQRQAGLSSTRLSAGEKKAYYGLAYLVVERLVGRIGIDGLHALCVASRAHELDKLAQGELLVAAGMGPDRASWRAALVDEYEEGDLRELVRMHPGFLVHSLDEFFAPCLTPDQLLEALPGLQAELALCGGGARLELLALPEVRERLAALWESRSPSALARR